MNIKQISQTQDGIYHVELIPSILESVIGVKPKTLHFKNIGAIFTFDETCEYAYVNSDGTILPPYSYITKELTKWRKLRWQNIVNPCKI